MSDFSDPEPQIRSARLPGGQDKICFTVWVVREQLYPECRGYAVHEFMTPVDAETFVQSKNRPVCAEPKDPEPGESRYALVPVKLNIHEHARVYSALREIGLETFIDAENLWESLVFLAQVRQ